MDERFRDLGPFVKPNYDYLIRPPAVDDNVERLLGVASLVVGVGCLMIVIGALRGGTIASRWAAVVVWAVVSGVAIGGTGRVVTAGTDGANIGGSLLLVVLPLGLLVGWTITAMRFASARRRESASSSALA